MIVNSNTQFSCPGMPIGICPVVLNEYGSRIFGIDLDYTGKYVIHVITPAGFGNIEVNVRVFYI